MQTCQQHVHNFPNAGYSGNRMVRSSDTSIQARNNDLTSFHKRKPSDKRGDLFVLRPGGAKRRAEMGKATNQLIRLKVQSVLGPFEQFTLFSSERLEAAALAGVEQCFAEKFPVRSMNQRMRCQNLRETRKRPPGRK